MNPNRSLIEVVQSLYAAFGRGDIPTVLAGLRADVQWSTNVDPTAPGVSAIPLFRVFSGRADVANFFTALGRDLEFHVFEPQSFMSNDREVASRLLIETTVRSTGKRLREEALHVFTFDEAGMVARFREFADTLGAAAAWEKVRAV